MSKISEIFSLQQNLYWHFWYGAVHKRSELVWPHADSHVYLLDSFRSPRPSSPIVYLIWFLRPRITLLPWCIAVFSVETRIAIVRSISFFLGLQVSSSAAIRWLETDGCSSCWVVPSQSSNVVISSLVCLTEWIQSQWVFVQLSWHYMHVDPSWMFVDCSSFS